MRICVVCASNQNRSMEAHSVLSKKGFADVVSFGTNTMIKVPGPTPTTPNTFPFGTTYADIAKQLQRKDEKLYRQNGLLMLLERNATIKPAPQRFQDRPAIDDDLIITCEERCFDIVTEDLLQRAVSKADQDQVRAIHVVNFDIVDSHEEAVVGSKHILQFVQSVEERLKKGKRQGLDLNACIAQSYEETFGEDGSTEDDSKVKTLYSLHLL